MQKSKYGQNHTADLRRWRQTNSSFIRKRAERQMKSPSYRGAMNTNPMTIIATTITSPSTTFLLHRAHWTIRRHDFRSPIGVVGVGNAVYGSSGISFGKPQWSGSDHEQARQPQPVDQMFGADAREIQLDGPRVSSSPGDDVAENGGDLRIGQFVTGYLEQHERES